MKIDFGIVNYNGGDALIECVKSLEKLQGGDVKVFVYDNASIDGSAEKLNQEMPSVNIQMGQENLGYAGALNRLIPKFEGDISVLCNMDLVLDENWLTEILKTFTESPEIDSVASLVLEMGTPPILNSGGIVFYGDFHPQSIGSGKPYLEEDVFDENVFGSYGALMSFRREVLNKIVFDEDYFLFFEETDFFFRFNLMGHKIKMNAKAKAWHFRSLATKRYSLPKLYFSERNRVTTVLKLAPISYWLKCHFITLYRFANMAGEKPQGNESGAVEFPSKTKIIFTLFTAWAAAWLRLPSTLKKRKEFWSKTNAKPKDTLALLKKFEMKTEDLSIR